LITFGALLGAAAVVLLMLLFLAQRKARQAEIRERNVVLEERVRLRTAEPATESRGRKEDDFLLHDFGLT
jgi:hypothetical protein